MSRREPDDEIGVTLRVRLVILCDRLLAALLATLLVGAGLAFGGAVWWARPAIGAVVFLFLLTWLVRVLLDGAWRMLKSPLVPFGVLAVGLALVQLAPLPEQVTGLLSPGSRALHLHGAMPERTIDPSADLPEPESARAPIAVDRPATIRWLVGAAACLALFWGVGHYTDRPGRLYLVWGCVVVALFLNTTLAAVQLLGGAKGFYGFVEPGRAGAMAPSLDDLLTTPNTTVLRPVAWSPGVTKGAWAVARPARPFLVGSLPGGPGAYLALSALGLPLALGLLLHLLAPRGSREAIWSRLRHSGQGGLALLLGGSTLATAFLVGLLAGPGLSVPFAVGLIVVGLPGAWTAGLRWSGVGLTLIMLTALGGGVAAGQIWAGSAKSPDPGLLLERKHLEGGEATRVWADSLRIVRDFPAFGTGLGGFASIFPHYKTDDRAHTTAESSVLQWAVEAGGAGLLILGLAAAWCAWRLPGAVGRVGSADRVLAFALVGTAACFGLFAAVHWTVELAAIAILASAVGGTANRWLAGGTDLFLGRLSA